jgi:hypothetical protein
VLSYPVRDQLRDFLSHFSEFMMGSFIEDEAFGLMRMLLFTF